eukprot:scaffold18932_cov65-Phaeocystis_antarctica.AAC.5
MGEPPPSATIESKFPAASASTQRSTLSVVGSGIVSVNTSKGAAVAESAAQTLPTAPLCGLARNLSATTSGRLRPMSASSVPSRCTLPPPWMIARGRYMRAWITTTWDGRAVWCLVKTISLASSQYGW